MKFMLVCLAVCAALLLSYQILIRYSWGGTLLNGPRTRPGQPLSQPTRPTAAQDSQLSPTPVRTTDDTAN
jgi:hypothetical protein